MAGSRVLSHMSELLQALSPVHVSFRVPPLVYSTRRDRSAERRPLPCVPSSHCATHLAGSVSPVRHTSRLLGSCTYLLWGLPRHLLYITHGSCLASPQCGEVMFSRMVLSRVAVEGTFGTNMAAILALSLALPQSSLWWWCVKRQGEVNIEGDHTLQV